MSQSSDNNINYLICKEIIIDECLSEQSVGGQCLKKLKLITPLAQIWQVIRSLLFFWIGDYLTRLEQIIQIWFYSTLNQETRGVLQDLLDVVIMLIETSNPSLARREVTSLISNAADVSGITSCHSSNLTEVLQELNGCCKKCVVERQVASSSFPSSSSKTSTTWISSINAYHPFGDVPPPVV